MKGQLIVVTTLFDITPTGVRSHFNAGRMPFKNNVGQLVDSQQTWELNRNQQRNWETFQQCISLRCQPISLSTTHVGGVQHNLPGIEGRIWQFNFIVEREDIFANDQNQIGLLLEDLHGVPMLIGLEETHRELFLTPYILVSGPNRNTEVEWFDYDSE